jgi:predicted permease
MGAGRGRLIGQLLAEASLLAFGGTLFAIWVSQWAGDALAFLLPRTELPVTVLFEGLRGSGSARVWIFSALVCGIATTLAGVVPVLYSGRVEVQEVLKEGGRSGMAGTRSYRARGLLVAFEIALASVALIGAGLFTRSFENARAVNPGFDMQNVLVAHIYVGQAGYPAAREVQFDARLRERLERAPGVQAAAYADWVPLWFGESPWEGVRFEGGKEKPEARINRILVSPGYFGLLGVPVVSGRDFTEQDDRGTPLPVAARGTKLAPQGRRAEQVAIVNQEFARRYFGSRDPVGRRIEISGAATTVVGMVRNFKHASAAEPPTPYVYKPFRQGFGTGHNNFVYIRSAGGAAVARGVLRQEMAALEPATGLYDAMPMTDYAQGSLYQHRVAASLMAAMGILSLLLAAVGLYSVMAYAVTERTQEIGIRMALGAQPRDVLAMVLRGGLAMTALGLGAGIAGALAMARVVAGLLFHVSPADPLTFIAAALFLTAVAVLACWIPARRATRLDPLAALRCA